MLFYISEILGSRVTARTGIKGNLNVSVFVQGFGL